MRKVLFTIGFLILLVSAAAAVLILKGSAIAAYIDRFGTSEIASQQVRSVRYEGNGTGGILYANDIWLSLNNPLPPLQEPSVGSTKDGKLGLAVAGKVFALGQLPAGHDDESQNLTATPENGDDARVTLAHSRLSWPTPLEINFMSGASPSWKRHSYQRLSWKKSNGKKLEMMWRYEQRFDKANGWTSPTMMREGSTGLVKVEITP